MRVNKQKARKDYPKFGIKKGDIYYSWQFRNEPEQKSLTYPKPQQLTKSDYLIRIYDQQDVIADITSRDFDEPSEIQGLDEKLQGVIDSLTELRDEQEEKKGNMPEALQESATGELLQERYDKLDEVITELENYLEELQTAIVHDDIDEVRDILENISMVSFD